MPYQLKISQILKENLRNILWIISNLKKMMIEQVKVFKVLVSKIENESDSFQSHYIQYQSKISQILKENL